MAGLDALYGAGAGAAFAATLDISATFPGVELQVKESAAGETPVCVQAIWSVKKQEVAWLDMRFRAGWVDYLALTIREGARQEGVFKHLIERHPELFASWGVELLVCSARNAESEHALMLGGFVWGEWRGIRRLVAGTKSGRMVEYREWLRGNAPEPEWHKQLVAGA